MPKATIVACVDCETNRKIRMMYFVQNVFFDNKEVTISSIVQKALQEYFEKHDDEYQKTLDDYHKNGGWLEL